MSHLYFDHADSLAHADAIKPVYTLVVPVYNNEDSIPRLLSAVGALAAALPGRMETVFVVDGSPDNCEMLLHERLKTEGFQSQLIILSRNFGSFAAIRMGLENARGRYFAVMAADLQEPPDLILEIFRALETLKIDIAIGTRRRRNDSLAVRWTSGVFWWGYRKLVLPDIPPGGADIFGCNRYVAGHLLKLDESHSSLISLLFWIGFRRALIPYDRIERREGRSGWTWRRRFTYLLDSIFAFTDLPIRLLMLLGMISLMGGSALSVLVFIAKLTGRIPVPGYAATVVIVLFFSALNSLGLAIIGSYAWRTFENTKRRPLAIIRDVYRFDPKA